MLCIICCLMTIQPLDFKSIKSYLILSWLPDDILPPKKIKASGTCYKVCIVTILIRYFIYLLIVLYNV